MIIYFLFICLLFFILFPYHGANQEPGSRGKFFSLSGSSQKKTGKIALEYFDGNLMKYVLISIFLIFTQASKAQSIESIMKSITDKNISVLIKHCELPFNFSPGSMIDDPEISDSAKLRKSFLQLFKENYFIFLSRSKLSIENNKATYLHRSYDKSGELESESTIHFYFRKSKNNKLCLYKIFMAG